MKKLLIIFASIIIALIFIVFIRFIVINEKVTCGVNSREYSESLKLNIARFKPHMNLNYITDEKVALYMVKSILGKKKFNYYKPWNVYYDEYYDAWNVRGSVGTPIYKKILFGPSDLGERPNILIKKNGEIIAFLY